MSHSEPYHILIAISSESELDSLRELGYRLARPRQGVVTLLHVAPDGRRPEWLRPSPTAPEVQVRIEVRAGRQVSATILEATRELAPDLLLLGWRGEEGTRRYLLGQTLDPVIRYASCDVAVVRGHKPAEVRRVLVPAAGGPNAILALDLALRLSPDAQVTALNVVRQTAGPVEVALGYRQLSEVLEPWQGEGRIVARVVRAPNPIEGILNEAANGYDLLLIGASNESYIDRKLFGNVPQTVAARAPTPTLIVRRRVGPVRSLLRQARRRLAEMHGGLTMAERVEAYRDIRRGARPSRDFFTMLSLAAAMASLGLLMNSPTVIIGAMVIAPLMSAIFGISMGIVQGDARLLWQAAGTTARGMGLALLVGLGAGLLAADNPPTGEMLSNARPTLLDLAVALLSGTAGAFARCRRNAMGSLAGVAIAVSLVPPLTTTGIGLTTGNTTLAGGAILLFLTNLSAIMAAGSVVFWFFGFRPDPGRRVLVFGRGMIGILGLLTVLIAALAALTVHSLHTNALHRALQEALDAEVATMTGVELEEWRITAQEGEVIHLEVSVRATHPLRHDDVRKLQERIAARLQRPVALTLSIVPVTRMQTP